MRNSNNEQPLDLTANDGISRVQGRSRDLKPRGKKELLGWGIPEINQPDVTTGNLSNSGEPSATTPIIDPKGFLIGCLQKGGYRKNQRPPTICKVSRVYRDLSESSFNPQLVSIGPIHREDLKLKEFEWLKECYFHDILLRGSRPGEILDACLVKVNTLIPRIRESYASVKKNYSDVELATMMVMDGCFILEFCFKHRNQDSDLPNKTQNNRIVLDLMLLENQVPFFVLQALFDCTMGKASFTLSNVLDECLAPYIKLFRSLSPEEISTTDVGSDHDHLLGYMHKRYKLQVAESSKPAIHAEESKLVDEKGLDNKYTTFHSIVELDRSGMNFKPHQESGWSMTIKFQSSLFACLPGFWSKATLLMPTLVIDDDTELILRNFIAYEQSFPNNGYNFTSYAHVMDMLVDTQEDIAKLVESKVLVNTLGSNQEAADMINKICKNITITEFYYTQEFKEIEKYYNSYWPKNIAWLRRVYFNNPWNAIALLAAVFLFSFTLVQTIYAVIGK